MKSITVLIGSLRRASVNRNLARALEKLGASEFEFVYADLANLPHYNDDLWANPPESVLLTLNYGNVHPVCSQHLYSISYGWVSGNPVNLRRIACQIVRNDFVRRNGRSSGGVPESDFIANGHVCYVSHFEERRF